MKAVAYVIGLTGAGLFTASLILGPSTMLGFDLLVGLANVACGAFILAEHDA